MGETTYMFVYMEKRIMNKQLTYDDIDAFLEGSLSAEREKEVEEAINSSKELQDFIEVTLDIDDMILFDEMKGLQFRQPTDDQPSSMKVPAVSGMGETKWGKYLSKKGDSLNNASKWGEEEYRQAADRDERKLTKLKSQKLESDETVEQSYWGKVIVGIIIMVLFILVKSCIF